MLFNSFQFVIFFIIVYTLYLFLNHKWQNRMLLVASYVFYGAWDWRFLSLIFLSTVIDYYCGIKIKETESARKRKHFLVFSIFSNLSILGFFKYYDFFASSLQALLGHFGITIQPHFLHIILPVGISFYTFQTMSYTIDIYRQKMEPTKKFLDFALFVSFFPQLVAGPIERAKHLLPQMIYPRKLTLDKFYEGCYLMAWGFFQKIFIADNLARIVDPIFAAKPPYNGAMVILGLYAFAFQIFCDFAGYSNIARGLGKVMGFDIMVNFNLPYFATNAREFWHRWHISLSTWLRDYLYIPLGGNKAGKVKTYRNLSVTMLLGGLWHGAAWTFVLWGIYHGVLLMIHRLIEPILGKITCPKHVLVNRLWFFLRVFFFFNLVSLGWLLFRAQSMSQVFSMFKSILFNFNITPGFIICLREISYFIAFLLFIQIIQYVKKDLLIVMKWPKFGKICFALAMILLYLGNIIFGRSPWLENPTPFIYFQF